MRTNKCKYCKTKSNDYVCRYCKEKMEIIIRIKAMLGGGKNA